jgi:hypothetical protein
MSEAPDEPFNFPIDPVVLERNARRLIDVLAQLRGGATSEELRIKFEEIAGRKRQTFYDALSYVKYRRWIVGGGGNNRPYELNPDGSWKPPPESVGQAVEKDRMQYLVESQTLQIEGLQGEVERLLDWSNGSDANGANVALSTLVRIVGDSASSVRQRLKAAGAVLGYRVHDDSAAEFTKRFLQSVCVDASIATDYRIEAGELLRKHEAPRVISETVRPSYRDGAGAETERREAWRSYKIKQRELEIILVTKDTAPEGWADDLYADDYVAPPGWPGPAPIIPLKALVVARKARQDRLEGLPWDPLKPGGNGNGSDEPERAP